MSDALNPMQYLNASERRLFGALVRRLCSTGNPRFQRALESSGTKATVRMACVNALRLYALGLFVLGALGRLAGARPIAYVFYGLAAFCMLWSFWCLYTVVGPERDHKRGTSAGRTSSTA